MSNRSAHSISVLLLGFVLTIHTFAAGSQVDFFAARSFGGNNSMFYGTEPGDFDSDGNVDVVTSSRDKMYVFFGNGTGEYGSTPLELFSYSPNSYYFAVTGDFNGDGRSDVVFLRTNPQTSQPAIATYFGNSDRSFAAPVFSSPNPAPQTLFIADLDADGHLDLIGKATSSGGIVLEFYKGDGTGNFTATAQIPSGDVRGGITVADFDNDGLRDIAYPVSDQLKVARNLGGNVFETPSVVGQITYGFGNVIAADVNNDGEQDLVASQTIASTPIAKVWLGAAAMSFTPAANITLNTRDRAHLAAIADLDLDGFKDLVFSSSNRTIVHRGVGDGTFPQQTVYVDGGGGNVFVRDVNSDQLPDIVANQTIEFGPVGSGSFSVILNLGSGVFKSAPTLTMPDGTKDIAVGNLNSDQLQDIVVVNRDGSGGAGAIVVLFQTAAANFGSNESANRLELGSAAVDGYAVTIGAFDQDNLNDFVVVGSGSGSTQNVELFRNNGNNTFTPTLTQIGSGDIYDVASADLNNDGKLDLVTANIEGMKVSFGAGDGTFGAPVGYLGNLFISKLAIGDLNNDQKPDIAAYSYSPGEKISVLLNDGAGAFSTSSITSPAGTSEVVLGNLIGDGNTDIAVSHGTGITIFAGVGNGTLAAGVRFPITQIAASGLTTADLNSDGRLDLAALAGSNTVVTLLSNGAGGFAQERIWTAGCDTSAIRSADLNNDQRPELVVGFTSDYSHNGYLKLFFNTTPVAPPTATSPFDFDGDGKTDIGIFRPAGAASEWWINQSSTGQTFALQFGASTDRIAPADYTGDGKADIAFFRPASGEWYVLRSEDFSFFALPFGTNGDIPVPADYDADGKSDFAVFRPSSSTWFISQSSGAPTRIEQFGISGDLPVTADYDGDGKADVGIFRESAGEWWINRSTAGLLAIQFGASTDKPVQGDYTGDGKADVAIWRPSSGEWFIVRSEDYSFYGFPFGANGDVVSPGDYDGDGKFDATVFRPSSATWFIARTTAGTQIVQFGATGDRPIPNAFVP